MPISKLAYFMNMTEQELIGQLMCFKHKMHNMVWSKGSSYLEGEFQSNSELDFYIDKVIQLNINHDFLNNCSTMDVMFLKNSIFSKSWVKIAISIC